MSTMMGIVAGRMLDAEACELAEDATSRLEKRQITRNRTSYSCQACRRRKVKCDKRHPICSGCEKTNDTCVYGKADLPSVRAATTQAGSAPKRRSSALDDGRDSPPRPSQAVLPDSLVVQGLEKQLDRLASLIEGVRREAAHANGAKAPPTPNSLSQRDSEEDSSTQREHSDSPISGPQHGPQNPIDLSHPLSELNITKKHKDYLQEGRGHFWTHMVDELEQLRYLIRGSQSFPAEKQLKTAMGLEHTDCNRPRDKPYPAAVIDDPIDIHLFQQLEGDATVHDCQSCFVKSGDKSTLLMPRRLRKLDPHTTQINITSNMPTEAQSNVLFRAWMTGVYPVMPVLPLRMIFKRHYRFWEWTKTIAGEIGETPDMYALPLLYAIWYTGALSMSLKGFQRLFPGVDRAHLCANYHDHCIRLLTTLSFPNTNQLWLLVALMMLQSAPCGEEEPLQNSDYVNLMVRLAQAQGIHREPTLAELHPFDAEIRRRIWWQILQLDTSLAVSSGFPTCTSEETSDVRPISQAKEMFIGCDEEQALLQPDKNGAKQIEAVDDPFSQSSSIVSVGALVARTYASIAVASRKLVTIHMRTRPVNKQDLREMNDIISATETEVRAVINNIPTKGIPEFGFTPDENSSRQGPSVDCDTLLESPLLEQEITFWTGIVTEDIPVPLSRFHRQRLAAFHRWARIFLSMMCDKMHCIAYAPFLKNLNSKLWAGGRQCALHHTSAYFRKFISLAKDSSLETFRWTWPGTAQPMHAAIILLVDVYERPQSVEAARSRALIDEVFALSAPSSGIVGGPNGASSQRPFREGGGDAWEMLRNLRASAWSKAGLDPNVLWTQSQQMEVGVAKPLSQEQKVAQSLREDSLYDEKDAGEDSQSVIRQALDGMQQDLRTAELDRTGKLDPSNAQFASMNMAPQAEAMPPSNRLLRLPTQQLMPFPLVIQASLQPSTQAQNAGAAAHIDATRYADDAPEEWHAAEMQSAQNAMIQPSVAPHVRQAFWNSADAHAVSEAEAYIENTASMSSGQTVLPTQPKQSLAAEQPSETARAVVDQSADQMDFAFDWDAWDNIFNPYSGFTEFLDDADFSDMQFNS